MQFFSLANHIRGLGEIQGLIHDLPHLLELRTLALARLVSVRKAGVNQQRVPRVERHTQSAVFCSEAGGDCQDADSKAQADFWAKDSRETLTKPFLPLCKKLAKRNPLAVSHHAFACLFRAFKPRASVMVDHWPIAMAAACLGLELILDALPVGFHGKPLNPQASRRVFMEKAGPGSFFLSGAMSSCPTTSSRL